MIELLAVNLTDLENVIKKAGFQKFRAKQIMDYIYNRYVFDFEEMLQLPKDMREWLNSNCKISVPKIVEEKVSTNGDTIKLLLALEDDSKVETVLMKQSYGNSICISSQVGCAMGCAFCASTRNGLLRNLEAYEMVGQGILFTKLLNERIHSIVVMGAGEPMQNYDNVIKALRFYHEKNSFDIGFRRMTISTCGIPEGIYRLADEGIPVTLALSLHAPTESIRHQIMPISRKYDLEEVLQAVNVYFEKTGRKITFEYILIDGINSSEAHAKALAKLLERFTTCNINLIPVNGNEHMNYYKPDNKDQKAFVKVLKKAGYEVVLRKEMGDSIQAACGQLKVQYEKTKK